MSNIATLSSAIAANTVQDHELVVLTAKQTRQIQIVREAAHQGDLMDVATSKDKVIAGMVLNQISTNKMNSLIATYKDTGNASGLVRWANIQIGTLAIPTMPAKKVELAGYESTISSWISINAKGDANTEKSQAARRKAVAWMAPIFAAIKDMNTITAPQTEVIEA